jgi:AcrR family transcriptional regulator
VPKISAPSIAEHVRIQEDAILAAAARLFAEQGFAATDLADIAKQVGLARSSLYRYFPDKDHILLRWFERELEPVIERATAIANGPGPAEDRLLEWMDYQLELVTDPNHDLAPKLMAEVGAVSPEVRARLGEGHARLYGTLGRLVGEALSDTGPAGRSRDPRLVTELLGGLVQAAARSAMLGGDVEGVRVELHHAALGVLRDRPPITP